MAMRRHRRESATALDEDLCVELGHWNAEDNENERLILLLHTPLDLRNIAMRDNDMTVPVVPGHRRGYKLLPTRLVHAAIDADDVKLVVVLQNRDVFQWVPTDQNTVREVARSSLAQLMATHQ